MWSPLRPNAASAPRSGNDGGTTLRTRGPHGCLVHGCVHVGGHARRVGLAGDKTPKETIDRLLPTIRYDVKFESDRIRDAGFANFHRIRQSASIDENTVALADFLDIPVDKAREIAATEYLYVD